MILFECYFRKIQIKEGMKVWQGETIHKTIVGYGYKEVNNQLKKIYGNIEIESIQQRYEINYMTPKVVYDIHFDCCQDFRNKIQENNKKQDETNIPQQKPSNVIHEEDEGKKRFFERVKNNGKK